METNLTIYVTFEGLGFCCFNPERGGAEIAFLRLPKHQLEITISSSDGRYKAIHRIADNAQIELVSINSSIKGYKLNNDGNFERQNDIDHPNDSSDLRWLLDCEGEELHNKEALMKGDTGSVRDLTGMFLPNAYFYTEQVLATEYILEREDTTTGDTTANPFGLIGDTLGARVDAVRASLLIDGKNVFQFDEDADPAVVTRFFVSVTNTCENPPVEPQSDFHKYYEVMDFQDNVKFDFAAAAAGVTPSLVRPRPAMCEFVLLGKTKTLAAFFK